MVVVGEAADADAGGARGHEAVGVRVVDDGGLAAAVRPHQCDKLGAGGERLQVQHQLVAAEAVSDAREAFEGEAQWFHAKSHSNGGSAIAR